MCWGLNLPWVFLVVGRFSLIGVLLGPIIFGFLSLNSGGVFIYPIRIPCLSKVGWVYPQYNELIDPSTSLVKKKIGALTVLSFSIASAFFKSWFGGSSDKKVPKRHHHKEMMKKRWKVQSDRFGKMVSKRSRNDITTKTMEETNGWKCESFHTFTVQDQQKMAMQGTFHPMDSLYNLNVLILLRKTSSMFMKHYPKQSRYDMFTYIWLILL